MDNKGINRESCSKIQSLFSFLAVLCMIAQLLCGRSTTNSNETILFKKELAPYVDFLRTQHTDPVNYIMGLFEKDK
jgi:hypothetical protein